MKYFISILLTCFLIASCQEDPPVRIHILGDSTTEQQNQNLKDQRGWPQMLPHFFKKEVTVLNHGKSGTSSRTFYEGKWWKNARETIFPGDYVVIQFGHNDEKHQGFDGPIGTMADGSYREYLQKFADEIRELGGIPIFATPIVRKMGANEKKVNRRSRHDLAEYVGQNIDTSVNPNDTVRFNYSHNMHEIAAINGCPLIDMTTSTANLINRLGFETATRRIYNFGDGTHICAEGALLFSQLFVDELKAKGILTNYIIDKPKMIMQPGSVDFGEVIQGGEYRQEIDLMKLVEEPDFSRFHIEAGKGVMVSDTEFGEYVTSIDLSADFDLVYFRRLYIKINPIDEGSFSSAIQINDGKKNYKIPVKAVSIPYPEGEKVSVNYSLNGNPKPETKGPILAIEHTFSGLERISFDQLGTDGIGSHLDPPVTSRAEWLNVPSGKWPKDEIDVVFNRYAQFGIQAAPNTVLHLEQIILFVGGGVNYRLQISKDASFTDYDVVGEGNDRLLTKFIIPVNQEIKRGETFYLRIYPWGSSEKNALLCLSHISFEGTVKVQQ